jgi:hypothetical protein
MTDDTGGFNAAVAGLLGGQGMGKGLGADMGLSAPSTGGGGLMSAISKAMQLN